MVNISSILSRDAKPTDIPEIMRVERESFDPAIQESQDVFEKRVKSCEGFFHVLEATDSSATARTIGYLSAELICLPIKPIASQFSLGHDPETTHRLDGDTLYISSFAIEIKSRGGIGKPCFSCVLHDILSKNPQIKKVSLLVHEDWHAAHRIYTSLGFNEHLIFPGFFVNGNHMANALYMELPL